MDRPSESVIKELQEQVAQLKRRLDDALTTIELLNDEIEALKSSLNLNSSNSSRPPSSDPPFKKKSLKRFKKRKRSGKTKGGQPGHQGHSFEILEPSRVVQILPESCKCGGRAFVHQTAFNMHQVVELPEIQLEVVHYQLNQAMCRGCGKTVKASLPQRVQSGYGPRMTALVAELSGPMRLSRRSVKSLLGSVFGFEVSVGGIQRMIDRASSAILPHWIRMGEVARSRTVNYVDETSWKKAGSLNWIWTMSGEKTAFLMLQAGRNMEAFAELVGDWKGLLVSDGYGVYQHWEHGRQTCLAHLYRKSKSFSECGDPTVRAAGLEAGNLLGVLFAWSQSPPADRQIEIWNAKMHRFMGSHGRRKDKLGAFTRSLEKHYLHLVTFICVEGVEPTNNKAERSPRFAVIWRKVSMGTDSEKGNRWVERVASLVGTCRNVGLPTFPILSSAVSSLFNQEKPALAWIPAA